jgi:hypothetical protein
VDFTLAVPLKATPSALRNNIHAQEHRLFAPQNKKQFSTIPDSPLDGSSQQPDSELGSPKYSKHPARLFLELGT